MLCALLEFKGKISYRSQGHSEIFALLHSLLLFYFIFDVRIKEHIIDLQGNMCVPLVCHRQCGPNHFIPKDNPSVGNEFLDNWEHIKIVLKYPLNE